MLIVLFKENDATAKSLNPFANDRSSQNNIHTLTFYYWLWNFTLRGLDITCLLFLRTLLNLLLFIALKIPFFDMIYKCQVQYRQSLQ